MVTVAWHTMEADSACQQLDVTPGRGLEPREAERRLAEYGKNRLAEKPRTSPWILLLRQFKSVLILVLCGAAVLAGVIGDLGDTVVILFVVLLNAFLGFYQEYRADRTVAALREMLAFKARVRRDGHKVQVEAESLVPGDIVLIEAGDKVPADSRLLQAHGLEIDESVLTGESHPVPKHTARLNDAAVPLAERANMAFMNSVVTRGRGELLVCCTGMHTAIGAVAGMLEAVRECPTPLQVQLDRLGKRLALIAGVVVTTIFCMGLLRGKPLVEVILAAIALAVAAIPEGLPAVVTVTLAIGMYRMARRGAIVKRLAAVETLGCTTVICSDKTGTLTLNQMTSRAFVYRGQSFAVSGEGYSGEGAITLQGEPGALPDLAPLLVPLVLCNDSRLRDGKVIGDPMEAALLLLGTKGGVDRHTEELRLPRIAEIPFDASSKLMATFHRDGEAVRVFVKGAPDVLLGSCTTVLGQTGGQPLDEPVRAGLAAQVEGLARGALRVLAVARGSLAGAGFDPAGDLSAHVQQLELVGLVGMLDPPRPAARGAIALCHQAGIRIKLITGDHKVTAAAIAAELGIQGDVLTGADLDRMDAPALAADVDRIAVFARTTPEHKVKIVQALKARGHVVAMTGDGVNDAAALKAADIGVAMGRTGTDVAKEAATMVLINDDFATIVQAVQEGRTIYDNIVDFVRFQLATNIGAILCVLLAPLLGLPEPFTPMQLLWINIIMDGPPALALAFDPARPGIMNARPRHPGDPILTRRRLIMLGGYGAVMAAGTLGLLSHCLRTGPAGHALSLAFSAFVLFQIFNAFNARAEFGTALNRNFFRNGLFWLALLGVVGLQGVVIHWSVAQKAFDTVPLSLSDWGLALGVASTIFLAEELRKLVGRSWVATGEPLLAG